MPVVYEPVICIRTPLLNTVGCSLTIVLWMKDIFFQLFSIRSPWGHRAAVTNDWFITFYVELCSLTKLFCGVHPQISNPQQVCTICENTWKDYKRSSLIRVYSVYPSVCYGNFNNICVEIFTACSVNVIEQLYDLFQILVV